MILTDLYFTTKMKMKIMLIKEIMMHVMLSYNSIIDVKEMSTVYLFCIVFNDYQIPYCLFNFVYT